MKGDRLPASMRVREEIVNKNALTYDTKELACLMFWNLIVALEHGHCDGVCASIPAPLTTCSERTEAYHTHTTQRSGEIVICISVEVSEVAHY